MGSGSGAGGIVSRITPMQAHAAASPICTGRVSQGHTGGLAA